MLEWLESYLTKTERRVIGLMSGTSVDGVDVALVRLGSGAELRAELEQFTCVPFPATLRERVLKLCGGGDVAEAARLNVEIGEFFAQAVLQAAGQWRISLEDIDLIGSHGQTVSHQPAAGATLQIGEPSIIAERTGITTVADFRPRDMAAGGQGAPLVPYVDYLLLRHTDRHRIVQNIGGIGNCTMLPADCAIEQVRAWDTGPGNMVIDACVAALTSGIQQCDTDGALAARGTVHAGLLEEMLAHPFLQQPPPKSAGREEFGQAYAAAFLQRCAELQMSREDTIATATAFTAASIAQSYQQFAVPLLERQIEIEVILGGGGAFNPTLRRMLQEQLAASDTNIKFTLLTHEDCGIPNDAKEAMAFAILAHASILGRANNVPGATGARHPVVLGKIVPGTSE